MANGRSNCKYLAVKTDAKNHLIRLIWMLLMMAHVDGILGHDFFRNFKIMLDFKGGAATVANQ